MFDTSWIFILAMATFALVLVFAALSFARTRRDEKNDVETTVSQDEVQRERQKAVEPQNQRH